MTNEKKFDVEDWGGYARCYDVLNSLRPYQKMQQTVVSSLILSPGKKILDAACGTGNLPWWITKGGGLNGTEMVGIDFSEQMIGRAEEKCFGLPIRFIKADLNGRLPFADNIFDQVVSINTLYALEKPLETLREFLRVLKPGGGIVLANPKKGYENGLILKEHCGDDGPDDPWLNAHASPEREKVLVARAVDDKETAARFLAIAEHNRRIAGNMKFHFFDADGLSDVFSKAGFRDISISSVYARQGLAVIARKGEINA